jgi:AraC-like DNA-binding protein
MHVESLADNPEFVIRNVTCDGCGPRMSEPELTETHTVVLVREGSFRRSAGGATAYHTPEVGYLTTPGVEQAFAHPDGGDVCTAIRVSQALWAQLTEGSAPPPVSATFPVDGAVHLKHQVLLRSLRRTGAGFESEVGLVDLLGGVLGRLREGIVSSVPNHRRVGSVVDAARDAIRSAAPEAETLVRLARSLNISPYWLSRTFRAETGVTLVRYRNGVRVQRVLDCLEAGEDRLADLAARFGFTDHAHLTRTVKAQTGRTPTQIRRLLETADHAQE